MRRNEADFLLIIKIYETLEHLKIMKNYQEMSRVYFIIDKQVRDCLIVHQPLHRDLRRVDFIPLTERDLQCEDYIRGRIKKMISCFELLVEFDKTYTTKLYNKNEIRVYWY